MQLISDTEFRLIEDQGRLIWKYSKPGSETRIDVLKKLNEGLKQKKISEILAKSPGQISKIRTKAIDDGLLTEKNKLTAEGYDYVQKETFSETEN